MGLFLKSSNLSFFRLAISGGSFEILFDFKLMISREVHPPICGGMDVKLLPKRYNFLSLFNLPISSGSVEIRFPFKSSSIRLWNFTMLDDSEIIF